MNPSKILALGFLGIILTGTLLRCRLRQSVVFPEHDMRERVAYSLINPYILDLINLRGDYVIVQLNCPQSWIGYSFKEIDVRKQYGVSVLAIYLDGNMVMNLTAETRFDKGDSLLVPGHKRNIEKVEALD